ncbi:MAG: very short patch repair endonuclease, partial [Geminicoccales bacterium]
MVDNRSPEKRSATMRAVRDKNTTPEWVVRRLLHQMGFRYRLHGKGLPGRPDLIFPGRQKAIFVHGCCWHGHGC